VGRERNTKKKKKSRVIPIGGAREKQIRSRKKKIVVCSERVHSYRGGVKSQVAGGITKISQVAPNNVRKGSVHKKKSKTKRNSKVGCGGRGKGDITNSLKKVGTVLKLAAKEDRVKKRSNR